MSTIKFYFTICSISFTFQLLLYAAFDLADWFAPITADRIFFFFLITVSVTALIALTDRLPIQNMIIASIIRIIDIVVVVFGFGFIFKIIPMDWAFILPIFGMIIVIYFGVVGILMMKDQADAKAINKQLGKRLSLPKQPGGNPKNE